MKTIVLMIVGGARKGPLQAKEYLMEKHLIEKKEEKGHFHMSCWSWHNRGKEVEKKGRGKRLPQAF